MSPHASETLTIRVPAGVKERLERLARTTSRSRSYLAMRAIESYLDLNEWQLGAIEDGVKDADAGRFVAHEDVETWMKSWGARRERKPPR